MFTGIITHQGTVRASGSKLSVRAPRALVKRLAKGGSIAVDGVCLTVVSKTADSFSADLMPETLKKTTLGTAARGSSVNLELPATQATFLSGHIVQGHVGGTGKVVGIRTQGASHRIEIAVPRALARGIVSTGSIAVNGVSLTVITASASRFAVGIILHTWKATNLGRLAAGSAVNIETDILAAYARRRITQKKKKI